MTKPCWSLPLVALTVLTACAPSATGGKAPPPFTRTYYVDGQAAEKITLRARAARARLVADGAILTDELIIGAGAIRTGHSGAADEIGALAQVEAGVRGDQVGAGANCLAHPSKHGPLDGSTVPAGKPRANTRKICRLHSGFTKSFAMRACEFALGADNPNFDGIRRPDLHSSKDRKAFIGEPCRGVSPAAINSKKVFHRQISHHVLSAF